jgi:hypothetical protein
MPSHRKPFVRNTGDGKFPGTAITLKGAHLHVGLVLAATGFVLGCGSGPDPSSAPSGPPPPDLVVAASPATTQELGVVQWKMTKASNHEAYAIVGYDDQDKVRSELGYWLVRDGSGAVVEGGSASTIQGPAYSHYTVANGRMVVDQNDFEKSPHASHALALVDADLETFATAPASDPPGAVNTASVHPLSLGGSYLVTPSPKPLLSAKRSCFSPVRSESVLLPKFDAQVDNCQELIAIVGKTCNSLWSRGLCPPMGSDNSEYEFISDACSLAQKVCAQPMPDDCLTCLNNSVFADTIASYGARPSGPR